MPMKLVIVVGSIRKESINLRLGKALAKTGADKFTAEFARIDDLPLINEDIEKNLPAPVERFKQQIEKADAVLFVTPEYNRSIPAPLKNAVDWGTRPYGRNSFSGKVAAITGASPGAVGTAAAQVALRPVLLSINMDLMGQPEIFMQFKEGAIDADGNVADEKTRELLGKFIDRLAARAQRARA